MKLYFELFGCTLPSYGFLICLGIIVGNLIALGITKVQNNNIFDFIVLEAYAFLGAFIGAKLLYYIVSYQEIEWSQITDVHYLNQLMQSGFIFYGGLIGALLSVFLAGRLHHLPVGQYLQDYSFLIPFIHAFGRIGCFMAGCCYGVPYEGPGAIIFPENSLAPSGVALFPIQLAEAGILILLAVTMLIIRIKYPNMNTVFLYLFTYGIIRFLLEYLRYDDARGRIGLFSTSQWISLIIIVYTTFHYISVKSQNGIDKKE